MKNFTLITIFISTFIILFFSNIEQKKYSNPLNDFEKSIFKILLVESEITNMPITNGTGFVIDYKDGKSLILTNSHVCDFNDEYMSINYNIFLQNYEQLTSASGRLVKVVKKDLKKDLCALVYDGYLEPIKLKDESELKQTDELYVIGAPRGNFPVISKVIFARKNFNQIQKMMAFPEMSDTDIFVVSGYILPGNSGSPVLNKRGEAVGIVFASDENTSSLVVPTSEILKFIENITF